MTDIINAMFDKLEDLFSGLTAQLTIAESERNSQVEALTAALAQPVIVQQRVAARFSTGYLSAVPTVRPTDIIGCQLARASIAISNLSDTAADTIWIGNSLEAVQTLGHPAYPLRGGKSVSIDVTSDLWVFTDDAVACAWIITEFVPS